MKPIFHLSPGATFAIGRLESRGYEAYAVGGCVRDSLLGTAPHDWDLTTNATPDETAAAFADCRVIGTGMKHGTVTVLYRGEPLEITTYRLDGAYADNRHPTSVTFSKTLADDLARRDFTVNAMAYHPKRGLVDLYGGTEDLARGVIRCVGDAGTRFREDGLRILRAVRFASVLGFSLEDETARAVHRCSGLLENIAQERIREEWNKLLLGKTPAAILHDYADVAAWIFPELLPAAEHREASGKTIFEQMPAALANAPTDLALRLAVFFHAFGDRNAEQGAAIADQAMLRLRYDNAMREEVVRLVRLRDTAIPATEPGVRRLLREMSPESAERLLNLQESVRTLPAEKAERVRAILRAVVERGDCVSLHTLAVNGGDLIAAGIPAGKRVGEILEHLLDRVIDGDLPNEKEALMKVVRQFRQ